MFNIPNRFIMGNLQSIIIYIYTLIYFKDHIYNFHNKIQLILQDNYINFQSPYFLYKLSNCFKKNHMFYIKIHIL